MVQSSKPSPTILIPGSRCQIFNYKRNLQALKGSRHFHLELPWIFHHTCVSFLTWLWEHRQEQYFFYMSIGDVVIWRVSFGWVVSNDNYWLLKLKVMLPYCVHILYTILTIGLVCEWSRLITNHKDSHDQNSNVGVSVLFYFILK